MLSSDQLRSVVARSLLWRVVQLLIADFEDPALFDRHRTTRIFLKLTKSLPNDRNGAWVRTPWSTDALRWARDRRL
jgi:hypothetical protein